MAVVRAEPGRERVVLGRALRVALEVDCGRMLAALAAGDGRGRPEDTLPAAEAGRGR